VKALLMLGAVLYPLKEYRRPRANRIDGFPLSYYPMFSKHRGPRARVAYAVGITADGTRHHLAHRAVGDGGENQVRHQLYRVAVKQGQAQEFADSLAARIAANPGYPDLVRVEIVRGRFDLDECMLTRRFQGEETVLAVAELPCGSLAVLRPDAAPGPAQAAAERAPMAG
jgi:hypothetical protein